MRKRGKQEGKAEQEEKMGTGRGDVKRWKRPEGMEEKREVLPYVPRRRLCLRIPPEDMFFSASISVKLREEAKIRTSTRLMRRCRKVTDASTDRPWDGSMFSRSC